MLIKTSKLGCGASNPHGGLVARHAGDWIELNAQGPAETKDIVADYLINECHCGGVVEDAGSFGEGFEGVFLEGEAGVEGGEREGFEAAGDGGFDPGGRAAADRCCLTAYLESSVALSVSGKLIDFKKIAKELKRHGWSLNTSAYTDVDWREKWKQYVRPVRAGVFFVRPTWHKTQHVEKKAGKKSVTKKQPDTVEIIIDPGMAFGTGAHHTTRSALRAISFLFKEQKKQGGHFLNPGLIPGLSPDGCDVLDVGTGSGILAIAVKKLGVRSVIGTDNDAEALRVARRNARLNRVKISLTGKPPLKVAGTFALVIANIRSGVLIELLPELVEKTAVVVDDDDENGGGFLVLSGILDHERADVRNAYKKAGLRPVKTILSGEWATLIMQKKTQRLKT